MLAIHRQYDDIVHTASPISFAQSKISPSGDHPVLAIDLKPTASCWSKDCKQFDSEDFSEIQPLPRLAKELASRPWAGSQYNFSGGVFFQNQGMLTMVPMTMMLRDAERSCSPQGGQIAQLNSDRCALRHLLLRSLQRAKYNVQVH